MWIASVLCLSLLPAMNVDILRATAVAQEFPTEDPDTECQCTNDDRLNVTVDYNDTNPYYYNEFERSAWYECSSTCDYEQYPCTCSCCCIYNNNWEESEDYECCCTSIDDEEDSPDSSADSTEKNDLTSSPTFTVTLSTHDNMTIASDRLRTENTSTTRAKTTITRTDDVLLGALEPVTSSVNVVAVAVGASAAGLVVLVLTVVIVLLLYRRYWKRSRQAAATPPPSSASTPGIIPLTKPASSSYSAGTGNVYSALNESPSSAQSTPLSNAQKSPVTTSNVTMTTDDDNDLVVIDNDLYDQSEGRQSNTYDCTLVDNDLYH